MIKVMEYGQVREEEIFARVEPKVDVEQIVADILADVQARGDEALFEYCKKFDGAELNALEVSAEEFEEAMSAVEPEFLRVLNKAAKNIREFHQMQKRTGFIMDGENGAVLGQKIIPIE